MILAVDFGTSNSLAAIADAKGHSKPLPLDESASDPTVFRTLLYFPDQNACFYGQKAIEEYQNHLGQGRFIRSIKKYLPSQSFIGTYIEDRVVRLEDLIGFFLLEMKKRAEKVTGQSIHKILLGRPAQYAEDPSADQLAVFRMQKAAEIAGFKETYFFEEPIAAALDLRTTLTDWKTVLVVDLGGGTSDFTVVRIGPGEFKPEHVLAKGAVSIAGDVIDGKIMAGIFAPEFGSKVQYRVPLGSNVMEMPKSLLDKICSPADITQLLKSDYIHFLKQVERWSLNEKDKIALRRLFTLCEDQLGFAFFERIEGMKKAFSTEREHLFDFPYPDIEIQQTIPRSDFKVATEPSVEKILKRMDEVIDISGVKSSDIELIYCTGGTSRLSRIQEELAKRFGADRVKSNKFFHSVIDGLAERASEILRS